MILWLKNTLVFSISSRLPGLHLPVYGLALLVWVPGSGTSRLSDHHTTAAAYCTSTYAILMAVQFYFVLVLCLYPLVGNFHKCPKTEKKKTFDTFDPVNQSFVCMHHRWIRCWITLIRHMKFWHNNNRLDSTAGPPVLKLETLPPRY